MSYIQGFVLPVKSAKKADYQVMAERSADLFLEYGALSICEAWQDDVPDGKVTSFPMAVKREADEVVVFAWVIWPDKKTSEACVASMEKDQRWADIMPADTDVLSMKRMIFGGFTPIVQKVKA